MSKRKLGKYEIVERIGRGGMAEVYRGYHAALDRYVAIKVLHPFLADDPEFKDRFENEARNVAKLKHGGIVQVYDFEHDAESDSYYMVMEFINGPTLKDLLFDRASSGERFPIAEAIRIVKNAAEALAFAHQRNMIHRDVKPANLMLDEDGRVVLTDFGIAKIVTGAHRTTSGGMIGTPAYMAPEQGLGEAGDERSDIYSLGVILFQLITGRLPFDADTPLAIVLKHVNDPLPDPAQFVPDLPDDLARIIRKALEKERSDRYQTAIQLAQDLSLLDETGRRRPLIDPITGQATSTIPSPFDTKPDAPGVTERGALTAAAIAAGLIEPPAEAPAVRHNRLHPIAVLGIAATVVLLVVLAGIGFGKDGTLWGGAGDGEPDASPTAEAALVGVFATSTATPTLPVEPDEIPIRQPTATLTARQPAPRTVAPTRTPSPSATPLGGPSATTTSLPTLAIATTSPQTATPSPTGTATPTPTRSPTATRTPTATLTPSPDLTGTALAIFYATLAAASPTPDMTQTLAACDFEYIVVMPERHNIAPSPNDIGNARLVRAGQDFAFDLAFQNVGSCAWPAGVRLSFNAALTENPDETVNLTRLQAACPGELRPGLNFARQEQPNFFVEAPVGITGQSPPIRFTGTAPDVYGCYYSVWELLYPNSTLRIGRPLVLAIRAWGGG